MRSFVPAGAGAGATPGLYLHVPFCAAVCPYCDFAVRTGSAARRARWVASAPAELALAVSDGWPAFDTLYLGGGTPSLLEPDQLAFLLDRLRASFAFAPGTVLHLEANPEDATPERLAAWRALGVGFLSLGVQALDDARLRFLGRSHDAATARTAVESALAAGFATVSFDLIYGLPGETPGDLEGELERATALAAPHLSAYQLSMPEGTRFGRALRRGELAELGEDAQAERFLRVHDALAAAGLEAYEVSNFARADAHRSRHNDKYWRHVPYLGLGPGAHSFDGTERWWNERRADDWEARLGEGRRPIAGREVLTPRELALEAVMLGLRTVAGIDLAAFSARHGVDLAATNAAVLERLATDGLVEVEAGRLRATRRGLAVADSLAARIDIDA